MTLQMAPATFTPSHLLFKNMVRPKLFVDVWCLCDDGWVPILLWKMQGSWPSSLNDRDPPLESVQQHSLRFADVLRVSSRGTRYGELQSR